MTGIASVDAVRPEIIEPGSVLQDLVRNDEKAVRYGDDRPFRPPAMGEPIVRHAKVALGTVGYPGRVGEGGSEALVAFAALARLALFRPLRFSSVVVPHRDGVVALKGKRTREPISGLPCQRLGSDSYLFREIYLLSDDYDQVT